MALLRRQRRRSQLLGFVPSPAGQEHGMDSERFRKLLDAPGPFASAYFDDSHDTHDARRNSISSGGPSEKTWKSRVPSKRSSGRSSSHRARVRQTH